MKDKIIGLIFVFCILLTLVGCDNASEDLLDGSQNTYGNCTAVECIKRINPENTVEEINSIIGFEGKLIDEQYNKYYWELSDDSGIQVTYYSGNTGTIVIDFDRNSVANDKVDFSRYDELQLKIDDGISYDEFITYIGNVEGTITEKSNISTQYVWVSTDGSYLNASFSNNSGKCTYVFGRIK